MNAPELAGDGARAQSALRRSRVYFTIVSRNYISYAATLMQSLETVDPEGHRVVVLADETGGFDHVRLPAKIIPASELGIPNFGDMTLRYQIMELNTAVKPFAIQALFERFPESIIHYIDPDILVLRPLALVETLLDNDYELALTPHITRPLQDGKLPDDLSIMKSGVWNLGFAAFRRAPDTERLVAWWADRCRTDCRSSVKENLFTDQRWMDLAPCFVEKTALVRDPGYNLAYWNLSHRHISGDGSHILVDEHPITFVHFSGIVPDDEAVFSKHQDRFRPEDIGPLRTLLDDYRGRLIANDWKATSRLPYTYGSAPDGRRIHDLSRRYYRSAFPSPPSGLELKKAAYHGHLPDWTDDAEPTLLKLGPPYLSRIVLQCWKERDDLHAHFAPLTSDGRRGLLAWFANSGRREHGVDDLTLDRAKRVAKFGPGVGTNATLRWPAVSTDYKPTSSGGVLEYLTQVLDFPLDDGSRARLPFAFALLWEQRRDLQNAFPLTTRDEWQAFLRWCYETGTVEGAFDKTLIAKTGEFFRSQYVVDASGKPTPGVFDPHVRFSYDGSFGPIANGSSPLNESDLCALIAYYVFRHARRINWPDEFVKPYLSLLGARDPSAKVACPLSRLLMRIHRSRPDLVRAFDIEQETGAFGLVGWFLLHGFQEYALDERAIDVRLRAFLASPRGGRATNLMWCVWAASNRETDQRDRKTNEEIAAWYEANAAQFRHLPVMQILSGDHHLPADIARGTYAISGYIGSASGRGEDVRMTKRALQTAKISPLVIDRAQRPEGPAGVRRLRRTSVDVNICHFNAESAFLDNTWHRAMGVQAKYSIGYWAWELSKFPEEWMNAFLFYDEIWASTEFARAAFASISPRPVHLMPMVVENPEVDGAFGRAHFGLPSDAFLFFFHFDFRSFVNRKNPEAAINAFIEAFPNQNTAVGLAIKTINAEHDPEAWERIQRLAGADPRIKLLNREMPRVEVTSMIAACDCYVSLHRSEGFGRGLAEAMLLGKPVIATAYSGNMDFCTSDTAFLVNYSLVPVREHEYIGTKGQVWADADVHHAATVMRTVFEDATLRETIATRGAETIRTKYAPEIVGEHYARRLREISTLVSNSHIPRTVEPAGTRGLWSSVLSIFGDSKKA